MLLNQILFGTRSFNATFRELQNFKHHDTKMSYLQQISEAHQVLKNKPAFAGSVTALQNRETGFKVLMELLTPKERSKFASKGIFSGMEVQRVVIRCLSLSLNSKKFTPKLTHLFDTANKAMVTKAIKAAKAAKAANKAKAEKAAKAAVQM